MTSAQAKEGMRKFVKHRFKAVVIGASTGGLKSLKTILSGLSSDFPLAVVIAIHRHPDSDNHLERLLDAECQLPVKQADEKETVKGSVVYCAPPNYHLLIENDHTFSLSIEEAVSYARPSIDVLFESAAYVYGSKLIGIVLTGANNDGSMGLKSIKDREGLTIVQAPETAEANEMPNAAIASADPDYILPTEEIGPLINKLMTDD